MRKGDQGKGDLGLFTNSSQLMADSNISSREMKTFQIAVVENRSH